MSHLLYIPEIFGISIEVYFILIILGIPVFFIWRRILKNRDIERRAKKIIVWIASIITTPLLYVGLILIFIFIEDYYPKLDFDKRQWMNNKDIRYEYSDDIIDSKMLLGKTKNEVRKILGDEQNSDSSDDWYYDLGYRPDLTGIDPDSLEIDFKDGKVISVVQHKR